MIEQQRHSAAVEEPNSVPTGTRFDLSSDNYTAGFPEVPAPQWLMDAAAEFAGKRATLQALAEN